MYGLLFSSDCCVVVVEFCGCYVHGVVIIANGIRTFVSAIIAFYLLDRIIYVRLNSTELYRICRQLSLIRARVNGQKSHPLYVFFAASSGFNKPIFYGQVYILGVLFLIIILVFIISRYVFTPLSLFSTGSNKHFYSEWLVVIYTPPKKKEKNKKVKKSKPSSPS